LAWPFRGLGSALPLLLFFSFSPSQAAEDLCRPLQSIAPGFTLQSAAAGTGGCDACLAAMRIQLEQAQKVTDQMQSSCVSTSGAGNPGAVSSQVEANKQALATTRSAISQTTALIRVMTDAFNIDHQALQQIQGLMQTPLQQALQSEENVKASTAGQKLSVAGGNKPPDFAGFNGVNFLHNIALERDKKIAYLDILKQDEQRLSDNLARLGTQPAGSGPGSGLTTADALKMAPALAGLGALAKNSAAGNNAGSITSPTANGNLPGTSPTPSATATGAQTNGTGLNSTSFGGTQIPQGKSPVGSATATNSQTFSPVAAMNGAENMNPGAAAGSSGITKGSGPAPASAGVGGGRSGGAGGSAQGPEAAAKTEGAAAGTKEEDNNGGGFFGGGFGGLGFGGSPASASSATSTESNDGLKDVYEGLKTAATEGDGQEKAAAEGVQGADSESLFSRIRNCVIRNIRKGAVMNGIGEKVDD
jgi:hypothetical protein